MNNAQTALIIKNLCKKKKVAVSKLLMDTSIRKSLIYDMEKRDWTPSAEVLEKIADYLDCSIDFLVGRTNNPVLNKPSNNITSLNDIPVSTHKQFQSPKIMLPLYSQTVPFGIGNALFDAEPQWISVEKNFHTVAVDFLLQICDDSMIPLYANGDIVLIKISPSINEGDIGIFLINENIYIRKMGHGELIPLNHEYKNISLHDYDTIYCIGSIIGTL